MVDQLVVEAGVALAGDVAMSRMGEDVAGVFRCVLALERRDARVLYVNAGEL